MYTPFDDTHPSTCQIEFSTTYMIKARNPHVTRDSKNRRAVLEGEGADADDPCCEPSSSKKRNSSFDRSAPPRR